MQPHLAELTTELSAKALVLGPPGESDTIAKSLKLLGIEPVLQHQMMSSISAPPIGADPSALMVMKRLFQEFTAASPNKMPWLHPGTTNWADRHELVMLAELMGLNPVSPSARVLSLFNNRLALLHKADEMGIPHLVLSFEPVQSVREVEELIDKTLKNCPVVLKAVRVGTGYDILVVHRIEELRQRLPLWLEQLHLNLGSSIIFGEQYLAGARLILQPFARFKSGAMEFFPVVDLSLQTHSRKVIEFCSPDENEILDPQVRKNLLRWSRQIADEVGFVGVGAFEFLVDGTRAYFVGGQAKLNEGYTLWQKIAGVNAVAWQWAAVTEHDLDEKLRAKLLGKEGVSKSSGLLARIYAVDSLLDLPQLGKVHEVSEKRNWEVPTGKKENQVAIGTLELAVSPVAQQEAFLGQLSVFAPNRTDAIKAARQMLDDVWIAGSLQTNERLVRSALEHPWVQGGFFHASFLEEELFLDVFPQDEVLQAYYLVCDYFRNSLHFKEGYWLIGTQIYRREQSKAEQTVSWKTEPTLKDGILSGVVMGRNRTFRVCAYPLVAGENKLFWQVRADSWFQRLRWVPKTADAAPKFKSIRSLVTGRVHSILFREDAFIPAHEPVLVVESLGILIPHSLPLDAQVAKWSVKTDDHVYSGQELAQIIIKKEATHA